MLHEEIIGDATIYLGDCLEVMAEMEAGSVDAVVTDPPYGWGFMGEDWDHGIPGVPFWKEALCVLKPGGHLLTFGGPRTFHRLGCAVEDAGFEIRDTICWLFGQGFPKSKNLKGEWEGWGTALKPGWEPIIVARKPFPGTVAANVLEHGTGAMNIDGCRIEGAPRTTHARGNVSGRDGLIYGDYPAGYESPGSEGRWPANVAHDGSEEVMEAFDACGAGERPGATSNSRPRGTGAFDFGTADRAPGFGDNGSAARFFYCAKASRTDRNEGLEEQGMRNNHPTVKPTDLMRWLCRLVTTPGGMVLDPFAGSGSTGKAASIEGFCFIGIEIEEKYFDIACRRIEVATSQQHLPLEGG